MRPGPSPPWGLSLLAGVLIAIFLAQAFLTSAIKSPGFDETGDIAAGLSYVQSGEIRANLQHPPLLKELAGLGLWHPGRVPPERAGGAPGARGVARGRPPGPQQ